MRLAGRTALITGAGSGIGKAIALRLAAEGAFVLASDLRGETAQRTASEIGDSGGKARSFAADVADPAQVRDLFAQLDAQVAGLDVVVNCAGIYDGVRGTLAVSDEAFERMLRVHLFGTFYCTRAAVERMSRTGGGSIINVSSVAALMGGGMVHYSAAKAGILGLTRAVAADVGPQGIRVNAICPGFIETPMTEGLGKAHAEGLAARSPLRRTGQPRDIADAALFLASDESSYMTGQWLSPNGGILMI
jgi:NAD(P)-dependent dehydrogenase (short-subunit alcohol dehydrogenase family)